MKQQKGPRAQPEIKSEWEDEREQIKMERAKKKISNPDTFTYK